MEVDFLRTGRREWNGDTSWVHSSATTEARRLLGNGVIVHVLPSPAPGSRSSGYILDELEEPMATSHPEVGSPIVRLISDSLARSLSVIGCSIRLKNEGVLLVTAVAVEALRDERSLEGEGNRQYCRASVGYKCCERKGNGFAKRASPGLSDIVPQASFTEASSNMLKFLETSSLEGAPHFSIAEPSFE